MTVSKLYGIAFAGPNALNERVVKRFNSLHGLKDNNDKS